MSMMKLSAVSSGNSLGHFAVFKPTGTKKTKVRILPQGFISRTVPCHDFPARFACYGTCTVTFFVTVIFRTIASNTLGTERTWDGTRVIMIFRDKSRTPSAPAPTCRRVRLEPSVIRVCVFRPPDMCFLSHITADGTINSIPTTTSSCERGRCAG